MNDLIIPVNSEAMSRALVGFLGEDNAKTIAELYRVIDKAMHDGYHKGITDGSINAKTSDEQLKAAFSNGFDAGADQGYGNGFINGFIAGQDDAAYDDGYVDGVSDARLNPKFADERVAELCEEDGFDEDQYDFFDDFFDDYFDDYALDDYDFYEGDSGDETDTRD